MSISILEPNDTGIQDTPVVYMVDPQIAIKTVNRFPLVINLISHHKTKFDGANLETWVARKVREMVKIFFMQQTRYSKVFNWRLVVEWQNYFCKC